jgi:hypothetical protein
MALVMLQRRVPLATLPTPQGIEAMQAWLEEQDLLKAAEQAEGLRDEQPSELVLP